MLMRQLTEKTEYLKDKMKEKQKKDEEKKSARELLKSYCSTTTAHGLGQVGNTSNIWLQVFWVSIFIGAAIGCIIQAIPLVKRFLSRPVTTKITLESNTVGYHFLNNL